MSFIDREKPNNIFSDIFSYYQDPTWDGCLELTWDEMDYIWDFFGGSSVYTNRTKPKTIFTNI